MGWFSEKAEDGLEARRRAKQAYQARKLRRQLREEHPLTSPTEDNVPVAPGEEDHENADGTIKKYGSYQQLKEKELRGQGSQLPGNEAEDVDAGLYKTVLATVNRTTREDVDYCGRRATGGFIIGGVMGSLIGLTQGYQTVSAMEKNRATAQETVRDGATGSVERAREVQQAQARARASAAAHGPVSFLQTLIGERGSPQSRALWRSIMSCSIGFGAFFCLYQTVLCGAEHLRARRVPVYAKDGVTVIRYRWRRSDDGLNNVMAGAMGMIPIISIPDLRQHIPYAIILLLLDTFGNPLSKSPDDEEELEDATAGRKG